MKGYQKLRDNLIKAIDKMRNELETVMGNSSEPKGGEANELDGGATTEM